MKFFGSDFRFLVGKYLGEGEIFRDIHILLAVRGPYAPDPVLRSPATRARIAREQIWNTPPEILPILFPDRESAQCRNAIAESPHRLSNSIPSVCESASRRPLARARETILRLTERRVFCPGRARPHAMTQRRPWIRFALPAMVEAGTASDSPAGSLSRMRC